MQKLTLWGKRKPFPSPSPFFPFSCSFLSFFFFLNYSVHVYQKSWFNTSGLWIKHEAWMCQCKYYTLLMSLEHLKSNGCLSKFCKKKGVWILRSFSVACRTFHIIRAKDRYLVVNTIIPRNASLVGCLAHWLLHPRSFICLKTSSSTWIVKTPITGLLRKLF